MQIIKDLINGSRYLIEGLSLLRHPAIRPHALIPLAINALIFFAITIAGILWLPDWLAQQIDSLAAGLSWLSWLLWPLLVIIVIVAAAFVSLLLAGIIAIPFSPYLSAAVMAHIEGHDVADDSPGFSLTATLGNELEKLFYAARLSIPLLLLSFIPVVQVIASPLWLLYAAWTLALEFSDYPFEHRGMNSKQGRQQLARRKGLAFGFGGTTLALSMLPLLNLLTIPAAVAGATAMVCREKLAEANTTDDGPSAP